VGKAEKWIVVLKLSILTFFIFVGFKSINFSYLSPATWTSPAKLIAGGMIIFLAYEGFELIANTAEDIKNPNKNLPLAYYISVSFVILLYVMVSLVAVGNLSIAKLVVAKDYALAEAAKPFLGHAGFILIAFAALLSTSSAVNATLYGSTRISYIIAKEGELPRFLEDKIWNRPIEGLLITSLLTLLIANLFNLSSISMMGSAGFLIIFAMVNTANFKLHKKTKSNKWISLLGLLTCFLAFALLVQAEATTPLNITVLVVMFGASFAIEFIYRAFTGREIRVKHRSSHHQVS
ncbi:MAG: APC family permease, partial [Caldiserica bacterium]|nr:APC family permease [Caldisericota bacterium]